MSEVINIPQTKNFNEMLTEMKIGQKLVFSMNHYKSITSKVSSHLFRYQYPGYFFSCNKNDDGKSFTVTRKAE